jgi:Metallopeptidase family M24
MNPAERIAIIQRTRMTASAALANTLGASDNNSSERGICDRWLKTTANDKAVCAEGWYQPPPGGACILIGHPEDRFGRLNYDSLRNPDTWSRANIMLREDSLVYAYASPFDRETGLIGDIGLTLYRGSEQSIWDHLTRCLEVTIRIASFAEVGMELRELFHYAQQQIQTAELTNETSTTQSGTSNIGHTVPWSYEEYPSEALQCLKQGSMQELRDMISAARVSINSRASVKIQPTMAFTVEPQISSSSAPICSYHLIVTFSEGSKNISPSFDRLFEIFGMEDHLGSTLAKISI